MDRWSTTAGDNLVGFWRSGAHRVTDELDPANSVGLSDGGIKALQTGALLRMSLLDGIAARQS